MQHPATSFMVNGDVVFVIRIFGLSSVAPLYSSTDMHSEFPHIGRENTMSRSSEIKVYCDKNELNS